MYWRELSNALACERECVWIGIGPAVGAEADTKHTDCHSEQAFISTVTMLNGETGPK